MKHLPPHIAWPLFVGGLLVLGILWGIGVVVASQIDGGAEVIEDYYEKAVNWDERAALLASSKALGWEAHLEVRPAASPEEPPFLVLRVVDAEENPVTALSGTVKALRPQKAKAVRTLPIFEDPSNPGFFLMAFPEASTGLWDFEVDVRKDTLRYYASLRKELLR